MGDTAARWLVALPSTKAGARCQVCLKFVLPLVPQYLHDGRYCGKVYSASNVFLSEWLEMKRRWIGGRLLLCSG